MHELSVCQGLIGQVERLAAEHGAVSVSSVAVAIGPLSGVEGPLLARAFASARKGTIAEQAMLEIEARPVVVHCPACNTETQTRPNALLCGDCGGWQVDLRSGDELLLTRVELARETKAA